MSLEKDIYHEFYNNRSCGFFFRIRNMLFSDESKFQKIEIFETEDLGKVFLLDGIVQTIEKFEFMYHEMLAHIPLFSFGYPKRVLVIGGGDGGTIREVLKHESVEEAVLCEIDEKVIEAAATFLPELSSGFNNKRTKITVEDGAKYIAGQKNSFDVILIDSTDPTAGEGGLLFTEEFYKKCCESLTEEGIISVQGENPIYDAGWMKTAFERIERVFPITKLYCGFSPQYPSGFWTYTIGSKKKDPEKTADFEGLQDMKLKYYNEKIHSASFALPTFLADLLK